MVTDLSLLPAPCPECSWSGFVEEEADTLGSSISGYEWALTTSTSAPYSPDVFGWTLVQSDNFIGSRNYDAADLHPQTTYR